MKKIQVTMLVSAFLLVSECAFFTTCKISAEEPNNPEIDGIRIGDEVPGKGTLVWRDEFNGNTLDLGKWNYDYGAGGQYNGDQWGWGNGEHEWYKPQNVRVENGCLVIEAKHDNPDVNFPYSSGKITTKGTLGSTNQQPDVDGRKFPAKRFLGVPRGYVEARLRTPKGQGFWPAFWMLGANCDGYSGYSDLGWPACGEIDIMETSGGQEDHAGQTIHYGAVPYSPSQHWYKSQNYNFPPGQGAGDTFHVYGVSWDANGLRFYVDDNLNYAVDFPLPEGTSYTQAFTDDVPFVIILNLAIGGTLGGGDPTEDSLTSGPWENRSLTVDWVRVYK